MCVEAVSDHQAVVNTSSSPSSAESAMTTGSVTVGQGGRGAGTADYVGASSGAGGIYRVLHTAELMLRGVPCVSTVNIFMFITSIIVRLSSIIVDFLSKPL